MEVTVAGAAELELLDTPGILWPKIETERQGLLLCATGAIRDRIHDTEYIAQFLIERMNAQYRQVLTGRYGLKDTQGKNGPELLRRWPAPAVVPPRRRGRYRARRRCFWTNTAPAGSAQSPGRIYRMQTQKTSPDYSSEDRCRAEGYAVVCGVDESRARPAVRTCLRRGR